MGANENRAGTICIYKMFLAREKALYQALNKMKLQDSTFIGYFWAPTLDESKLLEISAQYTSVRMVCHH